MNKRPEPPDPGYLLRELGYDDEPEAAASLGITPQTLTGYRRDGVGPRFVELARKIYYSKQARAEWLANGGTRQAEARGVPEPVAKSFPARVRQRPSRVDEKARTLRDARPRKVKGMPVAKGEEATA